MRYYIAKEKVYSAGSKNEVAEFLGIKPSAVRILRDVDGGEEVIDLEKIKRRQRQIEDAIRNTKFINEPTRFFEIGDPVVIGNLEGFCVSEVLANGKVYVISDESGDYRVVNWQDILKETEEPDEILFQEKAYQLIFSSRTVDSLLHMNYFFGVDKSPFYQRDLVWSEEQKVLLIDSIFNDRGIGNFVFIKLPFEEDGFGYEILDGKQRLSAIIDFYEDRITYKGKKYSELSRIDRHHFKNKTVSTAIIEDEISDKEKVKYFVDLNTAGTPVDPELLKVLESKYL